MGEKAVCTLRAAHVHVSVARPDQEPGEGVFHVEVGGASGASVPAWATPLLHELAPQVAEHLRRIADYLENTAYPAPARGQAVPA